MFLIVVNIFIVAETYQYLIIMSLVVLVFLLSKIGFKHLYRGMRPILWFVYFTFFLHVLINKDGELLWQYGFLSVYSEGIIQGFIISFRLFVLIFFSTILTLTTAPMTLTQGIEELLKPLRRLIPVHEIALMLTISIRFIPTILRETDKLIKAQTARGGSIGQGSILKRVKHVIPLVVPLLIISFKRAEELAIAMEARGYRGSIGRTKYRQLTFNAFDQLVLLIMILMTSLTMFVLFL
jgi:energy-coupling factor transport system permease protein